MSESSQPEPSNPDSLHRPEFGPETEAVLEASRTFSHELVKLYPQTNEDGSLRYYFAGSLATNLLVQSEGIEQIDRQRLPKVVVLDSESTEPFTQEEQAASARKIGDLDVVFLPAATTDADNTTPLTAIKGGDQLALSKFSPLALESFKPLDNLQAIFLDPLYSADPQVVRVHVDGQEYYIANPVSILANKVNHLCLTYVTSPDEKRHQLNQDLRNAFAIGSKFADRPTLIAEIHDTLMDYAYEEANATVLPTAEHDLAEDNVSLLQEVIAMDEDYAYFEKTGISIERAVGVLRLLHRFSSPDSKETITDYIATHKDVIDTTTVSAKTKNISTLVQVLLTDENAPDIRDEFITSTQGAHEVNEENLAKYLAGKPYLVGQLTKRYPDEQYEQVPERSQLLQMLMYVDETYVDRELQQLDMLLDAGVHVDLLGAVFRNRTSKIENADYRHEVIDILASAATQLDADRMNSFVLEVKDSVVSFKLKTDQDKKVAIQASCEKFGVSMPR